MAALKITGSIEKIANIFRSAKVIGGAVIVVMGSMIGAACWVQATAQTDERQSHIIAMQLETIKTIRSDVVSLKISDALQNQALKQMADEVHQTNANVWSLVKDRRK